MKMRVKVLACVAALMMFAGTMVPEADAGRRCRRARRCWTPCYVVCCKPVCQPVCCKTECKPCCKTECATECKTEEKEEK